MHKQIVLLLLLPLFSRGEGFEIKTPGQGAAGMAGAYSAVCADASSVYYNPGGLSMLEMRFDITAGGHFNSTTSSFLSGYNDQVDAPSVSSFNPHFFGSMKAGEKLAFGLGYYSSFGYHFKWDDDWEGRYVSQESKLSVYSLQPTVSYQVSEQLGIGAGLIYSFGNWDHRKAVPAGNDYGEVSLTGNGSAIGVKAGLFFAYDEDLKFGLTYRSAQTFSIDDGTYTYSSLPASVAADYPVTGSYSADLKLPSSVTASVSYRFTDELLATVEASYAGWSSLDSVAFTSATDSSFDFSRQYNLENSLSGRVGAEYAFTESFRLRGGFAYDISPFNSNHLLPEMPDANRIMFTMGLGYQVTEKLNVDFSAGMENFFERQGNDSKTGLTGTYKSIRYMGGLSVNLSF